MRTILEIMREMYGKYYTGGPIPRLGNGRLRTKHSASKRGYKHRHNPSYGQRRAMARVQS